MQQVSTANALAVVDIEKACRNHRPLMTRSNLLQTVGTSIQAITGAVVISNGYSSSAHAVTLWGGNDDPSRQLEFCLLSVTRIMCWAQTLTNQLEKNKEAIYTDQEEIKKIYLEARLGAKAILTGKVGSGANAAVYRLSTLQFRECVADLEIYYVRRTAEENDSGNKYSGVIASSRSAFAKVRQSLVEDLAALVEFDGLDTLVDPSPRASLALQQFSSTKLTYVQRILQERIIPEGKELLQLFPINSRQRTAEYMRQYHASEMENINLSMILTA